MQSLNLENDILVHCITAQHFPDDISETHGKLHYLVKPDVKREYFGISWMGQANRIVYKAGATELFKDELTELLPDVFIIRKGEYCCIDIEDYAQHLNRISEAFELLLQNKRLDPKGACIEWYTSDDCRCMVRLSDIH